MLKITLGFLSQLLGTAIIAAIGYVVIQWLVADVPTRRLADLTLHDIGNMAIAAAVGYVVVGAIIRSLIDE
jgi:hypothetical protein